MKAVQASVLITPTVGATYKIQVGDQGLEWKDGGVMDDDGQSSAIETCVRKAVWVV